MVLRIATNQTTTATTYNLGTNDDLYVPVGVTSISSDSSAASGTGSSHSVMVSGHLFGLLQGIALGSVSSAGGNSILVNASGSVESFNTAIAMVGVNARLTNHGTINSAGAAVSVRGDLSLTNRIGINNYGTISGQDGIFIASGSATINNFGTISVEEGVTNDAIISNSGNEIIRNRGIITGNFRLFDGNDQIFNRGTIVGKVSLENNDDLLDNRGGVIDGLIDMGAGTDIFRPGADTEVADGGTGIDTLDLSLAGPVKLALDGSIGATGVAAGDSYTGFENIVGSRSGANLLIGDGMANVITGGDTDDNLSGEGGNDTLIGGLGDDRLWGGSNTDILNGGDFEDVLTGGSGRDFMTGGRGADEFVFFEGDFSGATRSNADFIYDFSQAERDKINLLFVDARSNTAAPDSFTFIGTNAFSNVAGQLRVAYIVTGPTSSDTLILGDTNGDGVADFGINLKSTVLLVADDFIL